MQQKAYQLIPFINHPSYGESKGSPMDSKSYQLHARHAGEPKVKIVIATAMIDKALAAKIIELAQMVLDQKLVTATALSTVVSWADKDGNVLNTQVDKMVVSADAVHFETVSHDGFNCSTTCIELMTLMSDFGLRLQASDLELPDGDYELTDGAAWLGTPNFSVRIRDLAHKGIVVDVYTRGKEGDDSLGSLQVDVPEQHRIVVTEGLDWLILPDEGESTYTNHGDGREGDASALVAKVNADSALGMRRSDWRLPTIEELKSLIGTESEPKSGWFWSSTPFDDYCIRGVSFDSGFVSVGYRINFLRVRLVRTSQ